MYPDFKHKHTREGLWVGDLRTPPWVKQQLNAGSQDNTNSSDQSPLDGRIENERYMQVPSHLIIYLLSFEGVLLHVMFVELVYMSVWKPSLTISKNYLILDASWAVMR